jgi:hypothetical protein
MNPSIPVRFTALLAAALACAGIGCSRKNPPDFSGTYNGKSTMGMTLRMPDGTTDKDDLGDGKPDDDTYVITDDDRPEIRVKVLEDEDHCELKATRNGAQATFTAGQSCVAKNGSDSLSLKVSSGSVALSGDEVTIDVTFATTMKVDKVTVPGTMALHFEGKR